MADFSSDDFFARRAVRDLQTPPGFDGEAVTTPNKYDELMRASAEKSAGLSRIRQDRERMRIANEQAIVGKLGLDPESFAGATINNLVASAASPITVVGDNVASVVDGAAFLRKLLGDSRSEAQAQSLKELAKSVRQGSNLDELVGFNKDTGERASSLQRRVIGDAAVSVAKGVVGLGDAVVGAGSIVTGGLAGKGWDALGRDSKRTNQILDSFYSNEQQGANKNVEDATGFLATLEAGLENSSTIPHGIIQSLPSMLGGGAIAKELLGQFPRVAALIGASPQLTALLAKAPTLSAGVAGAIGEGTIMAGSQAEAIRQETADKLLNFKQSLLAAGTGLAGTVVGVGGNRLANALRVGDIDEAIVKGALAKSPRSLPSNVVLSGAIEGGEELLQSGVEQVAKNVALNKPWDQELGDTMARGLLTGTPMGMASGLGQSASVSAEAKAKEAAKVEATQAAIQSGDISAFLDPESPAYNPSQAVSALHGNSKLDTTTPEAKHANLEQASQIIADLETQLEEKKSFVERKTVPGAEAEVAKMEALLAAAPEDKKASYEALLTFAKEDLEQVVTSGGMSAGLKAKSTSEIAKLEEQIKEAKGTLNEFNLTLVKDTDVEAEVATLSKPVDQNDQVAVAASQASAKRLTSLAMVAPERLDSGVATQLADDTSNGLTAPQRVFLRAFSDARVAENELKTMGEVSRNIYSGTTPGAPGTTYVGIAQYRDRVTAALSVGNEEAAEEQINTLTKFMVDHTTKAGLAMGAIGAKQRQIVRSKDGEWINPPSPLTDEQVAKNGGLTINSAQLAKDISSEAAALTKVQTELTSAFAMRFNKPSKHQIQGSSNVTNQSSTQAEQSPQPSTQGQQIPAPTRLVGDSSTGAIEATVPTARTEPVGAGTGLSSAVEEASASSVKSVEEVPTEGQLQSTEHSTATDKAVASADTLFDKEAVKTTDAAVKSVFEATALSSIGTLEQYLQYLTDFTKDSAFKNVLFHYTESGRIDKALKANKEESALFFFDNIKNAQIWSDWTIQGGEQTGRILLAKAKLDPAKTATVDTNEAGGFDAVQITIDALKSNEAVILKNVVDFGAAGTQVAINNDSYVVLGSKEDAAAFGAWVKDQNTGLAVLQLQSTEEKQGSTSLVGRIAEAQEYLKNPPVDYTTASAKELVGWSEKQISRLTEQLKQTEDADEINRLEDMRVDLREVVKQGKTLVEADGVLVKEGLEESEVTATQAQYDEAVRVKESSNESDYDSAPSAILAIVQALNDEVPVRITSESNKDIPPWERESFNDAEELAQDTASPTDLIETETGALTLYTQPRERSIPFRERKNQINDFTQQSAGREGDATQRPLVAAKNFLSTLLSDAGQYARFLKTKAEEITPAQRDLINTFQKTASEWQKLITEDLIKGNQRNNLPEYFWQDPFSFLVEQTGTNAKGKPVYAVDENVSTAVSYAAFSAVVELASKGTINDADTINGLLGRKKESVLPGKAYELLGHVGSSQNMLRNSWGDTGVAALGLTATKNAPQDFLPKVASGLGTRVEKLLLKAEILERYVVTAAQMSELQAVIAEMEAGSGFNSEDSDNKFEVSPFNKYTYLRLKRDAQGNLSPQAQAIVDAHKETHGILDNLFSVEGAIKHPSFEPLPVTQKTTKSGQDVPKTQLETLKIKHAEKNQVREDVWKVLQHFSTDIAHAMWGVKKVPDSQLQSTQRIGLKAKNAGLIREYDNYMDFVKSQLIPRGFNTPFYFTYRVWNPQRVGIETNTINPQASKGHRNTVYQPAWDTDVRFDDQAMLDNFKLRVAEGLGIKPEKGYNVDALIKFEMLTQPALATSEEGKANAQAIQDAVLVLREIVFNDLVPSIEQQNVVNAAVQIGGQDMHSFNSLMALAQHDQALASGAESFVSQIYAEMDGVSNGIILAHATMGAAASPADLNEKLARGGIYTEESGVSHFGAYKSDPNNKDTYEQQTETTLKIARDYVANPANAADIPLINAALYFLGTLDKQSGDTTLITSDGRNLSKSPVTEMVFGSGMNKSLGNMANNFIQDIYASINDLASGRIDASREDIITNLNTLLRLGSSTKGKPAPLIRQNATVTNLLNLDLHANLLQFKAIKRAFMVAVGNHTKQAIESSFAPFLAVRKDYTAIAGLVFSLYDTVYQSIRSQYIEELIQAEMKEPGTGIAYKMSGGKPVAIHDLSKEQEAVVVSRAGPAPTLSTPMSKASKQPSAGLKVGKSKTKLSGNSVYTSEVQMATPFPSAVNEGSAGKPAYSSNANSNQRVSVSPGVSLLPLETHSTDSYIIDAVQKVFSLVSAHDAAIIGIGNAKQGAELLNKTTWTAILETSPLTAMLETLSNTVSSLAALTEKGLDPSIVADLDAVLNEFYLKNQDYVVADGLKGVMEAFSVVAARAERTKYEAMSTWTVVDQYAWEGGSYTVTAEDRAEAAKRVAGVSEQLSKKQLRDLQKIEDAIKNLGNKGQQNQSRNEKQELDQEDKADADEVVDVTSPLKNQDVLNIPRIQAMQLLEETSQDTKLSEAVRTQAQSVMAAMIKSRDSLKDTVLKVLDKTAALGMVDLLSKKFASIDASIWGNLKTKRNLWEDDPVLVQWFNDHPVTSMKEVMQMIKGRLTNDLKNNPKGMRSAFNMQLLKQLERTVDTSKRVYYITPSSPQSWEQDVVSTGAAGWYSLSSRSIYVKSPDFQSAWVDIELLLHEMIHAALNDAIDLPNELTSPLIADLNSLMEKAETFATDNGLRTKYNPAFENLHEFITYGMTRPSFQREVLNLITVDTKTKANGFVTGMKAFIDTVVGILFAGSKKTDLEIASNGITVLITNVGALFEYAAQAKDIPWNSEANRPGLPPSPSTTRSMMAPAIIDQYSTLEIHEALDNGTVDPAFQAHLGGLLSSIVSKLHGPYGAFANVMRRTEAGNPLAVWLKAMETGNAPFAASILTAGFQGSAQEDFAGEQVEATIRAALEANEPQTRTAYKELYDLFTWASKTLQPADFGSQEQWDAVFKPFANNGERSDYLARFAALGLTNQQFNAMLKIATERDTRRFGEGDTFTQRLQNIFEKILSFFNNLVTKTYQGQNADAKLELLVKQLVDIEANKRVMLATAAHNSPLTASVEEGVKKVTDGLKAKIEDWATSDKIRNSGNDFIRAGGAVVRTIAGERVDKFFMVMQKLHNDNSKDRKSLSMSLLKEITGHLPKFQKVLRGTKHFEGIRKGIISQQAEFSLKSFGKLSIEERDAITPVLLRTGMHNLLGQFSLAQIESLLDNDTSLSAAIKTYEGKLSGPVKNAYIKQANVLGLHLATGEVRGFLMMNAHIISRMLGDTVLEKRINENEAAQAEETIKVLISLYALKYTAREQQKLAKNTFRSEMNRTDGNGVEYVLSLSKELERQSLERLFKGNPVLMSHGFTPDLLDAHTQLEIADDIRGQELLDLGYKMVSTVASDPADPNQSPKKMYFLSGAGLTARVSGAMLFQSLEAKGTKIHSGYMNSNTQSGLDNTILQATVMAEKIKLLKDTANPSRDLSKETGTNLAPVYNEQGSVVNFRYMMKASTKDAQMKRDNRFDKVIGVLAGSIFDKQTSKEHNRLVINALHEQYELDFDTNRSAYVQVGPKSDDKELQEVWNLMSDQARADARSIWGRDGLWIHRDAMDIIFGYRKLSAADSIVKAQAERAKRKEAGLPALRTKELETINAAEKLFVGVVEWMLTAYAESRLGMTSAEAERYAKRAAVFVTRSERAWQEIVRETKDIIVVRTGLVMLGNIWSNNSMLLLNGVSIMDMAKRSLVALKGATAYQKDEKELARIQTLLGTGYNGSDKAELETMVVRLQDAMDRNPVKKLIDAGLMPTIVEDISPEDDIRSYKSALAKKLTSLTSGTPEIVKNVAKTLYMSRETPIYQTLSSVTQLSDFVARYVLYEHVTTRKKNPLSHEDAVQQASDSFVNYDIPMHRTLQFTDDMGITMFTKYFLRIQKPLLQVTRDKPARVLSMLLLGHFVDLGPIVLEGSWVHHLGNNPLRSGIFEYPGVLDNLATVQAGAGLIK